MRILQFLALAAILATLPAPRAAAQSGFSTLYTFEPGYYGQVPTGVIGVNGALYGTTAAGGANYFGSVFELQPPAGEHSAPAGSWTETNLVNFTVQNAAAWAPWASLVAGAHGVFYGTTADGGTYGAGTVFALQRPATAGGAWKTSLLYNFGAPGDGVTPYGSLVIDAHGELYGTTWEGGAYDYGTVFQLRQPATPGGAWTETVLYTFTGQSDGANPWGLSMSAKGDLYGATVDAFGGYAGTIYELAPTAGAGGAWTHSVLHAFTGGTDGCYPFFAPVAAEDGTVYGTTYGTVIIIEYFGVYGDGTVFKLEQSAAGGWQKTVLHNFASAPWGPDSPLLIRDGAIYGTAGDRISLQGGQVFELQPPVAGDIPPDGDWSIRVLHQFDTGVVPYGTIAMDANGVIFGTTGGVETVSPLVGTAYRLEP